MAINCLRVMLITYFIRRLYLAFVLIFSTVRAFRHLINHSQGTISESPFPDQYVRVSEKSRASNTARWRMFLCVCAGRRTANTYIKQAFRLLSITFMFFCHPEGQ